MLLSTTHDPKVFNLLNHTDAANKLIALFAFVAEAISLSKYTLHADVIFLALRDEHAVAAEVRNLAMKL